jgi:hypothetical protein
MEPARALSVAVLALLAASLDAAAQSAEQRRTTAAGPAQVTRLPIAGLDRIVQPDGSVIYLSTDRRFVFRGEMTDLWTGDDVGITTPTQRVDLARNGVRPEAISIAIGSAGPWLTAFVAPECAPCVELVRDALRLASSRQARFRVVLLDSSAPGAHANRLVWCAKDTSEALRSVYLEGKAPKTFARPGDACDQFGLYQAKEAAKLFGIGQLPLVVDASGVGHVGLPESLESLLAVRNDR